MGPVFSGLHQRLYFGVGCDLKDLLEQTIPFGGPDWAEPEATPYSEEGTGNKISLEAKNIVFSHASGRTRAA